MILKTKTKNIFFCCWKIYTRKLNVIGLFDLIALYYGDEPPSHAHFNFWGGGVVSVFYSVSKSIAHPTSRG